jgi:hypothetical protein
MSIRVFVGRSKKGPKPRKHDDIVAKPHFGPFSAKTSHFPHISARFRRKVVSSLFSWMRVNDVVHVLGRDGDPEQFIPFEWLVGCDVRIGTFIDGRVVSIDIYYPHLFPRRMPTITELHTGVANAYIAALYGSSPPGIAEMAAGLSSWLCAAELYTRADSHMLSWTGPIRFHARPTFSIRLLHAPDATFSMHVTTEARAFINSAPCGGTTMTPVRPTGPADIDGRQALLACDVLRALCDVTCIAGNALLHEYDFGDTIGGDAAHDPNSTVVLPPGTDIEVKVRPFCTCVMCASPICDASPLKQMDTYEEMFRDVSVCRRCLSDCLKPRAARYLNEDGTTSRWM